MIIDILDDAKEDIVDGGQFYRLQGGEFLKNYFIDTIFSSIDPRFGSRTGLFLTQRHRDTEKADFSILYVQFLHHSVLLSTSRRA